MGKNRNQFRLGRKLMPKKEMYITTSDGEKYRIKDVIEVLMFTSEKSYNSVFEFNVTRKIKPSAVHESTVCKFR